MLLDRSQQTHSETAHIIVEGMAIAQVNAKVGELIIDHANKPFIIGHTSLTKLLRKFPYFEEGIAFIKKQYEGKP